MDSQYHITVNFQDEHTPAQIENKYTSLFELVAKLKINVIYIKIFKGNELTGNNDYNPLTNYYNKNYLKPLIINIHQTSLTNSPISAVCFFGIERQALSEVDQFYAQDCHYIAYQYKGLRYLWGTQEFKHASLMFAQCNYALRVLQFTPKDIIRTWFYIHDIHKNYMSFNNARKEFFDQNQIDYHDHANNLPASTGIEGSSSAGNSVMQLTAIQGNKDLIWKKRIYNTEQSEADGGQYLFRPTFSRAMLTEVHGLRELHISGTASVGKQGETLFIQDGIRQIETTLHYINHLLENVALTPFDICEGTVFMKHKQLYDHFLEICKQIKFPHEIFIPVLTNICREDLLFEIDGIAITKI